MTLKEFAKKRGYTGGSLHTGDVVFVNQLYNLYNLDVIPLELPYNTTITNIIWNDLMDNDKVWSPRSISEKKFYEQL